METKILFSLTLVSLALVSLFVLSTAQPNGCEPLKIHHVVDMSTTMNINGNPIFPLITIFPALIHLSIPWKNSMALSFFSDKPSQTQNSTDKCYENQCSHFNDFSGLQACYEKFFITTPSFGWNITTVGDGGNSNGGSQFGAVINAVRQNWDTAYSETGKKVVFLNTLSLPGLPSIFSKPSFPASGTNNCDNYNYATTRTVKQAFEEEDAYLMILTNPIYEPIYKLVLKSMGKRVIVGSYLNIPEFLTESLDILCTSCHPSDAALQLMHLQDVSSSYHLSPNYGYMKTKLEKILNGLKDSFGSSEFGLGAYSDKSIPYSGYKDDFCYQERLSFTSDVIDVIDAYEALKPRSGRDFKESQLDALRNSINSTTMSWHKAATLPDGHPVMRVVMLATDSSPHEKGVFDNLPPQSHSGCSKEQYPTFAEIKDMLDDMGFFAVIVSTRELAPYWTYKVRKWNAKVVTLADDSMTEVKAIEDAFTEMCLKAS